MQCRLWKLVCGGICLLHTCKNTIGETVLVTDTSGFSGSNLLCNLVNKVIKIIY
jgi:hypothetical protein